MMNEVPMARDEDTASPSPMYLSSTMAERCCADQRVVIQGSDEVEKLIVSARTSPADCDEFGCWSIVTVLFVILSVCTHLKVRSLKTSDVGFDCRADIFEAGAPQYLTVFLAVFLCVQ